MNISKFYPLEFNADAKGFNSLMRTLLIKASYDGVLKRVTSFKGMYLSEKEQECWTLKFEGITGIYGVLLSNIKEEKDSFISEFNLYYFPSSEDKYLQKSSLIEEYLAHNKDFIKQVRDFSAYPELFMHFKIATIELNIHKNENSFIVSYLTKRRTKVYAKDGVEDKNDLTKHEYIIKPNGIDKNFPSLRLTLPFFNFLNTLLTRINNKAPSFFNIYKTKTKALSYNKNGNTFFQEDSFNFELNLQVGYQDFKKVEKSSIKIKENTLLYNFMKKGTWYDTKINFEKFTTVLNEKGLKPRLIVVSGFLGSGKTNFLQNFIEYETQANRFVGIIQNEIGKTGLDSKLLDYDYSVVEIDEGCVCCSLAGQLRAGVLSLLEKSSPDVILLETTGVANPFNLLSEIEELKDLVEFESIITVVDAKNCKQYLKEYLIFRDQIRAADTIILNKIDLVTKEELEEIKELLVKNNKCAHILETIHCEINPTIVSNYAKLITSSASYIASEFTEEAPVLRTHLMDHISSIKKEIIKPLNRKLFEKHLKSISNDIIRIKGFVSFEDSKKQFLVQFVNKEYEIVELASGVKREEFLIYIGKYLNNHIINGIK